MVIKLRRFIYVFSLLKIKCLCLQKVEMGNIVKRMCGVDMMCHDELPPDGSRTSFTSFLRHNFREISFTNIGK